mgnify:CR=1 FL=1
MKVKVFGMDKCAGCETVKALLSARGVDFVVRDVMNVDHMEEAQKAGVRSVPTTLVTIGETEHVFVGSAKATLDSILLHVGA